MHERIVNACCPFVLAVAVGSTTKQESSEHRSNQWVTSHRVIGWGTQNPWSWSGFGSSQ